MKEIIMKSKEQRVWEEEAEWAKIEAAEYQQKKKQSKNNKLINKIKKLFGGVEI